MTEESDARISVGLDPNGLPIHISEAEEYRARYYTCPICGDFLIVRHGDINIWHYAHYSASDNGSSCPLRTENGIRHWTDDMQISPVERKINDRELRLAIFPDYYTNTAKLCAILPTLDWSEISNIDNLEEIIDSIKIEGKGIAKMPSNSSFHPSKPELKLQLNPDESEFLVEIKSDRPLQSVCGSWSSAGIKNSEVFSGNTNRAELLDRRYRRSLGDYIYTVNEKLNERDPEKGYFSFGGRFLTQENSIDLEEHKLEGDETGSFAKPPFEVNVILPQEQDPSSFEPILVMKGETMLAGIKPKLNLDPELEIVPVPRNISDVAKIPAIGNGLTRFYEVSVPDTGKKRISIHWGTNHVFLSIYSDNEGLDYEKELINEVWVGIKVSHVDGTLITVYPWERKTLYIPWEQIASINTVGPNGLFLGIRGIFPDNSHVEHYPVKSEEIVHYIENWSIEQVSQIDFIFETLGKVTLKLGEEVISLSDDEICKRLLDLGVDLNKKPKWSYVRKILSIEPGTNHKNVGGNITLKRLRRIFKKLRNESGTNVE